jgi:hypothetical protein
MRTGSFRNCANLSGAISISNGVPNFYHGPQYRKVCPRRDMLKMPREDYDFHFDLILKGLDPKTVYDELIRLAGPDPILLCWERANTWCHRRWVAEWLEMALGIEVTEYGLNRSDVIPYDKSTSTPPSPPRKSQLELF